MLQQPTDSTTTRPLPADTAAHARPAREPHERPKTVYRVLKSLPADDTPDPYANIPTFDTPTSDVLGEQELKV